MKTACKIMLVLYALIYSYEVYLRAIGDVDNSQFALMTSAFVAFIIFIGYSIKYYSKKEKK